MTLSDEIVTINLVTMLVTFPECSQTAEGMHPTPPHRGIASLCVVGLGVLQWPETRCLLTSDHWEALLEL